jgi:hypothetical protein
MEQRRHPRTKTLKAAKILFNSHRSVIDCTVRNMSASGACVHVASSFGIPEKFDMMFEDRTVRPCRTVWRRDKQLGVAFEEGSTH